MMVGKRASEVKCAPRRTFLPINYTPLIPIDIPSIYNGPLPKRLALCTPDTKAGILAIAADLKALGFGFRLSDLFRSHEAQQQAHLDFVQGRKKAFSPPAGGSMHEAGRAMDIDLSSIGVSLVKFWEIAAARGFTPIIDKPDPSRSESWHFDCRGSHDAVYRYLTSGKAGAVAAPYTQMAQSGILAIGVTLDTVPAQDAAFVQAGLIRLGADPGKIDGVIGDRTTGALKDLGGDLDNPAAWVDSKLHAAFPAEYGG
jgi:hypothetical protein